MADEDKKLRVSGVGSGRQGGRIRVRARAPGEGLKLADSTPDPQTPDITGAWEEDGAATLRINRAGSHLEGWLVDYRTKVLTQIGGDLTGERSFETATARRQAARSGRYM